MQHIVVDERCLHVENWLLLERRLRLFAISVGNRESHGLQHLDGVACAEGTISPGGEMQVVGSCLTSLRRCHIGVGQHTWQAVDGGVGMCADTVLVGTHCLTGYERHLLRVEVQVADDVAIDFLHLLQPPIVIGIRLALMQQDAPDDTVFLCPSCHLDEPSVRISPISSNLGLQPVGLYGIGVGLIAVFIEEVDGAAVYRHVYHTDSHLVVEVTPHDSSEEVDERHSRIASAERWVGHAPLPHFPIRPVDSRETEEIVVVDIVGR